MAIQIKVPAVGESISEVTIANWLKKDGDTVNLDEVIAELESDKATFELTAPGSGVLKILKPAGSTVPIGELICEVEPSTQTAPPSQSTATHSHSPVRLIVPHDPDSGREGRCPFRKIAYTPNAIWSACA